MAPRLNCWEIKRCGREPGGDRVGSLGVCPAATDASADGVNGGRCAGRVCWAVAGTFCNGVVQGAHAAKYATCMLCDVFERVQAEEGFFNFHILKPGQTYQERSH